MSAEPDVVARIQAVVDGSEEADQILLGTISCLADACGAGVGLRFLEDGEFADGPWAGQRGDVRDRVPIRSYDELVGEFVTTIALDGDVRATFAAAAALVGDYCLVGWDIGGADWEP